MSSSHGWENKKKNFFFSLIFNFIYDFYLENKYKKKNVGKLTECSDKMK